MKNYNVLNICILSLFLILCISTVSAVAITDTLHVNIQSTNNDGSIKTGTFDFTFNISTSSDCLNIVYTNTSTLTTDSRGVISTYLRNVNMINNQQYWLCYYRNGILKANAEIGITPYAFWARNVTWEGIVGAPDFVLTSDEGDLNVNSSLSLNTSIGYIKDVNSTWFDIVIGKLTMKVTQLTSFIDDWLTSKSTDDLSEGSTNKYDNQSWNENYLLNKENTFTENQTFLNYTCYNADCSARIYHNGSGIMIES